MSASKIKQSKRPSCARIEYIEPSRSTGKRRNVGILNSAVLLAVAVGAVQVLSGSAAMAISGTWSNTTTGGFWGTAGNWFSGNVADGSGSTADFGQLNLLADNTVKLNVNRTIGNLIFGDTTASNNWTLDGNSFALNLAVAANTPLITVNNQTANLFAVVTGSQGLAKAGAGKLILSGTNVYTGGTFVNNGTLALIGSGAVLPANQPLTVNSGATFNYGDGNGINNSGAAIGALNLNNGTYRVSGGSGDFYLNQLNIGATGGTVDFSGTTNHWTHFTGAGAGITVNADSTWTGAATSRIQNDTSALLPITINNGKTVTSSVNFSNGTGSFGYRLTGNNQLSTLFLKNPTAANTADFRVETGTLRVDDMAALGSGTITLAGALLGAPNVETTAFLRYSGPTATSSKTLTLDAGGGRIYVSTAGTTLTLSGVIGETGGTGRALDVNGADSPGSVLVLSGANTYTGPTGIHFGAVLSIPTIANGGVASPLGMSSAAPANLRLGSTIDGFNGTLRYTGPTANTDRGATMVNAAYKSEIDIATAGTTLTMSGQLVGPGGLTKAGPGTLLLTGTSNTYANGTTVDAGTLAVGTGAVLPSGKNLTVNNGATFNHGNGAAANNIAAPIGTMTLNNGTYRVSGGSGDFYLNQLAIGATGGTVDFTGTSAFYTHFTDTGAGITVNADSTWTGAASSRFQNDTAALLPFTINNDKTVTSSVTFANGANGFGYRLLGGYFNALYLKNPTATNSADFRVENNTLRVDDMAALGSGAITLAGAISNAGDLETTAYLQYSGPTASSSKALMLDSAGGVIWVSGTNNTLTLNGVISETGGTGRRLVVDGASGTPSTLVLTAANTYTGPTAIGFGGILSIPTIVNGGVAGPLGMSSSSPANLVLGSTFDVGDGTLRYTGPTASTDRGATFKTASYRSVIDVATAGTTLTMSGQLVGAGGLTKAGPGTLLLTSSSANTYANGTTVDAGTLSIGGGGAVLPAGKPVTVNSGATFDYDGNFTNSSAAIGTLTLNNGTYRVDNGNGDFYMNQLVIGATGGSVNFAGSSVFFNHFVNAGAGITVNTSSTWTGGGGSRLQNDTSALLPLTINSGTVTSSINFANGSPGFGFRLNGDVNSVLYLKNPTGTNSADFRVDNGFLRVDDMAALGSGVITLAGTTYGGTPEASAVLRYSGPTASSTKALSLDNGGGIIDVLTGGATLTLSGVISETGGTGRALGFWGPGSSTLALTAANTYTGATLIGNSGILSIPTIANGGLASPLGASSNAPGNLRIGGGLQSGGGTLRYTGATANTDRGVTLNSTLYASTIEVTNPATTLAFSGAFVGPGTLTKTGPGTLRLTGANTYFSTTTVQAGTLVANTFAYTTVLNTSNDGLDIQGGKFIFDYTGNVNPVATVKSILTAGYAGNFATGQIRATTLAPGQTLGYGDNGTGVTVMLTLPGDANLDGAVNFNDFLVLQTNFGQSGTRFDQGNFNYDGQTNFNDFLLLQTNYGQSISDTAVVITASEIAALTAFAAANTPVPEPVGLALFGVTAALLGRRRRAI